MIETGTVSSGKRAKKASGWYTAFVIADRVILWLVLAAVFAMVIVVIMSTSATILSTDCDDGNQCTVDLKVNNIGLGNRNSRAWCENRALSQAATCTSTCYEDGTKTYCDGLGGCASDNITACKGYCTEKDDGQIYGTYDDLVDAEHFAIKDYFYESFYGEDTLGDPLIFGAANCAANKRFFATLQVVWATYPEDPSSAPWFGAFSACSDLLNESIVNVACIETREFDMDSNAVADLFHNTVFPEISSYWNHTTFRTRACVFSYACSQFNISAMIDPANLAPTSASASTATVTRHPRRPPTGRRELEDTAATLVLQRIIHAEPFRKRMISGASEVMKKRAAAQAHAHVA